MADNRGKRHSDDGMSAPASPAEFMDVKRQKTEQASPEGGGIATPKSSFSTKSMPPPSSTGLPMTPGNVQGGGVSNSNSNSKNGPVAVDPEHLSDALIAAGIDLREEEALLSSSAAALPQSPAPLAVNATSVSSDVNSTSQLHKSTDFLDLNPLTSLANKVVSENGVGLMSTTKDGETLGLISAATQEWLSKILTETVIASRYRQNNTRNNEQSAVAKALRQFAIKDKENEDRHLVERASLLATYDSTTAGGEGDTSSPAAGGPTTTTTSTSDTSGGATNNMNGVESDKKGGPGQDGLQYRAANATAAMMSFGGGRKGKKYSWMSAEPSGANGSGGSRGSRIGGGPGGGSFSSGSGGDGHGIKIRQAREEPYVVMRDLLGVLETTQRRGVEKIIAKGYSRIRD